MVQVMSHQGSSHFTFCGAFYQRKSMTNGARVAPGANTFAPSSLAPTYSRAQQSAKVRTPKSTQPGTNTITSAKQPWNAEFCMDTTVLGSLTTCNWLQFCHASLSTVCKVGQTCLRRGTDEKALLGITPLAFAGIQMALG